MLARPRDNPDVGDVSPCDDGAVPTTVLIVDDHADFRAFARSLLQAEGELGRVPQG